MLLGFAYLFGWAVGAMGIVAFASLIGTITLQIATDESLRAAPSFKESFKTMLISILSAVTICLALLGIIHFFGKAISARGIIVLVVVGFLVKAGVLSFRLKHPVRGNVGFGRACWLTTLQLAFAAMLTGAAIKLVEFMTT